ncbi:hypothetical protein CI109_103193 [Kwoniella shandongensis]|uniref:Uncharacterized protein n=1 Tax=Kwoniella shandongensis TaxID=1734106 RepID=A0A5M6CCI3_9TREE|nr:uncharacterized protein CI109_000384 [Kwoniella shandongensis]KAA5531542.1 hypothetical protein CI109_000384 [Kwoniella shandongensis]
MSLAFASSSTARMFVLRTVLRLSPSSPSTQIRTLNSTSSVANSHPNPNLTRSNSDSDSVSTSSSSSSSSTSTSSTFPAQGQGPKPQPQPRLTRSQLHRLHHLSALHPPPSESEEETTLLSELDELISLMDRVKVVDLPTSKEDRGKLLGQGVGEVRIDESVFEQPKMGMGKEKEKELDDGSGSGSGEKTGKELLDWATTRVGDFYSSKLKQK